MAGCWVALGCPSWAMTLQLCMIHSISQTRVGLVTEIGSDGTASVYKQLRRKDWECQDLRGLLSDGVSASFYTIKGPRRQKCRTSRRGGGGTQSLFRASAPGSELLPLTQRSLSTSSG